MRSVNDENPLSPSGTVAGLVRGNLPALALCLAAFGLLFWKTLGGLVEVWGKDPDFSHGFLVPPICILLLWLRRKEIAGLPAQRSLAGLGMLAASLLVHFAGRFLLTDFLLRLGMYGTLVGALWFILGTRFLRATAFPLFFFGFAIPPPGFLFGALRMTLRQWATAVSADLLTAIGLPALLAGNTIVVGEHPLEVADACSGIRSLMVIVASAVFYAYIFRSGILKGALVTLSAIPVTVLVNILRIMIVAVCLERFGFDLTGGFRHDALSIGVFGLSLGFLFVAWKFFDWLIPGLRSGRHP